MKRPRQHIIETKSKKRFEALVPDTWVARELNADYGLDYLIEIFKDNNSTGHLFFVQLKGTDNDIVNDTITLEYFSIPVTTKLPKHFIEKAMKLMVKITFL